MGMAQLEEQARMNYLAYCAQGKDYSYLSDDLLDEMLNRTPLYEHPHFKDVLKGRPAQRDGIWNYQKRAASRRSDVAETPSLSSPGNGADEEGASGSTALGSIVSANPRPGKLHPAGSSSAPQCAARPSSLHRRSPAAWLPRSQSAIRRRWRRVQLRGGQADPASR